MTRGSELPPGTFIDRRYQIRYVLGRGGFGRTYLAADERRFGDLCVLKEFVPKNQGDSVVAQKLYELFHREAKILHKLNHPQIPKFFAVFEEDDRLFIAQEFINGKTYWKLLQERQQRKQAFSEAEIFYWLCDLLPVLSYLHEQNIVHRDISPDNIMLPNAGRLPVLIDFGVVKQAAPHWYEVSTITPDGSVQASVSVGKLGYAPYEQIRIGQCSPRSDLYALGVTAAVLLTGKPPNHLIDSKSLEWKWQSYRSVNSEFACILEKMMADKPQDRYPSAEAVLDDLRPLEALFKRPCAPDLFPPTEEEALSTVAPVATALLPVQPQTGSELHHSPSFAPTLLEQSNQKQKSISLQMSNPPQMRSPKSAVASVAALASKPLMLLEKAAKTNRPQNSPSTVVNPSTLAAPPTRLTVLVGQADRQQFSWKRVVLLSLLSIVPIGGIAVGIQSPRIASLCEPLNNCTEYDHIHQGYRAATQQANYAKTLSENAKRLEDLKQAHDRLKGSIAQLNALPTSSQFFSSAQQTLPTYRALLEEIEMRLEKETRAFELLKRAEGEAKSAAEKTKTAKNNQEFAQAQSQWRKALATLGAIPGSSFVANQATIRSQEYGNQLQDVNRKLASMSPATEVAEANQSKPSQVSVPSVASSAATPASATPAAQPSNRPSQTSVNKPQTQSRGQGVSRPARSSASPSPRSAPSISLAPSGSERPPAPTERVAAAPSRPAPSPDNNRLALSSRPAGPIMPGNVNLSASHTVDNVSVRLDGAHVNSRGTYVATFLVQNSSDRAFGFVPVFAEVRDANGQTVGSRVMIPGSEDALVAPGETLQGEVYLFDRYWNSAGAQDLTLVIREGTSGNRNFYVQF
ncbi:MAG: hypothetical protein Kow00121_15320 [Elainellaceae cyanobacterium]